jgi:hypothetical protein
MAHVEQHVLNGCFVGHDYFQLFLGGDAEYAHKKGWHTSRVGNAAYRLLVSSGTASNKSATKP